MFPFNDKYPSYNFTRIKEVKEERQVRKEKHFEGTLTPQRGQNVWSFNLSTYDVKIVEPVNHGVEMLTGAVLRKIIMEKDCLYCCAINRKNAERKFMKMIAELTTK